MVRHATSVSRVGGFVARAAEAEKEFPRRAPRPGASDASGAAESDDDLSAVDDDRDAPAAGEVDHALELDRIFLNVDVSEGDLALRVVLTGRGRVGSGVLAEDLDAALLQSHG
jgi:hypothetical protein